MASVILALEDTMRAKLVGDAPFSAESCIFRVPQLLRKHNPEAYQPHILSIGPLHRGTDDQLKPIQDVKQRYLQNLLSNMNNNLRTLIEEIFKVEGIARGFYAESLVSLNPNDFVEMIILDGCFLIQLFRNFYYQEHDPNDPIFNMDFMFEYLYHDLLLLENQLPWLVLDLLYDLTPQNNYPADYPSLRILILLFFSSESSLNHNCKSYLTHICDKSERDNEKVLHILDLIRTSIVFPFKEVVRSYPEEKCGWKIPPATALSEAGVKFKRCEVNSESILNIIFKDGVLTIPQLMITEFTEPLLRNLIAFEQCYHGHSHQITSYAVLLDRLIGSSKDMEFLCEGNILDNWLSAEDGSQVFNKLYNDTLVKEFLYHDLCGQVNIHYNVKWNQWLAKLKREYLANPWMIISLGAATLLLGLTILQTVYALEQYYKV